LQRTGIAAGEEAAVLWRAPAGEQGFRGLEIRRERERPRRRADALERMES
jgi:hypothetical protein